MKAAGTHMDPMGIAVGSPSVRITAPDPPAADRAGTTGRIPSLPAWMPVALIVVCAVVASTLIPD